jgi:hypothetical protein
VAENRCQTPAPGTNQLTGACSKNQDGKNKTRSRTEHGGELSDERSGSGTEVAAKKNSAGQTQIQNERLTTQRKKNAGGSRTRKSRFWASSRLQRQQKQRRKMQLQRAKMLRSRISQERMNSTKMWCKKDSSLNPNKIYTTRRSPSSLPHLICGNKNEFLTHF